MLRDRADELTLEVEVLKMSSNKRGSKNEGRRSRRGSLLSDYTQTAAEEDAQYSGQVNLQPTKLIVLVVCEDRINKSSTEELVQ